MVMESDRQRPPPEAYFVGIGIRSHEQNRDQRHVAIVYNPVHGETRLSHLPGDYRFTDELWDGSYLWQVAGDLDEMQCPTVVARLTQMRRACPPIPYGFEYKNCGFDFSAEVGVRFTAQRAIEGVSCATFIMCFFESIGLTIANPNTWPVRPEDEVWARNLANIMANQAYRLPTVQQRLREARDSKTKEARIRPEELAGAFVQRPWPVSFAAAEAVARQILEELAALPLVRAPLQGPGV